MPPTPDMLQSAETVLPIRNPGLEVADFDSDAAEPMALCEVPSGGGPARYAVARTVVDLVELFDGRCEIQEAIALYGEKYPGRYSVESLERLIHDFLLPRRLILASGEDAAAADPATGRRKSFLYLQLPLLGPRVVQPIAAALAWAFRPWVILAWIPLFVLLHVYFYGTLAAGHDLDFNRLDLGGLLVLMLLSTLGSFLHELGHATAAASFGCRRLEIGWGLYLVFTVLYTDVSEAWRLPRRQRAVVDIGGIYFQSFFLAAMTALYVTTGAEIYLFAFLFSDLALASSLNPFLRLDGYWLMSDLFGIPNLRQQTWALLRHGAGKLGLGSAGEPPRLSRSAVAALAVYTLAGGAFFVFLMTVVLKRVVMSVVLGFPKIVAEYWTGLPEMTILEAFGGMVEIGWRGLMLVGIGFMLFNLLNRLVRLSHAGLVRLFPRLSAAGI